MPNKLITWEWEKRVEVFAKLELPSATLWPRRTRLSLTLYFNSRRGRWAFYRVSHIRGEDHWQALFPKEFGIDDGPEVDLKPIMGVIRDLFAELLAREFAGAE